MEVAPRLSQLQADEEVEMKNMSVDIAKLGKADQERKIGPRD